MQIQLVIELVVLLAIANGTPVLARLLLGHRWEQPLDGGLRFIDHRPLLGPSKTLRGLLTALLATTLAAPLFGLHPLEGTRFALLAMLGDVGTSFIKRRLGLASSRSVPLLDQLPETVLPLWVMQGVLGAGPVEMAIAVALFILIDLLLTACIRTRLRPNAGDAG